MRLILALKACALLLVVTCVAERVTNSTIMEASLDDLRSRFRNQLVIGFEELWDERGDQEVSLGRTNSPLQEVIQHIRLLNPQYKVEVRADGLVMTRPEHETADPAHLLDVRLKTFRMPPDHCIWWAIEHFDRGIEPGITAVLPPVSYAPELSELLIAKRKEWYRKQGREAPVVGFLGGGLGSCDPVGSLPGTRTNRVYHNVAVRDALNLMAVRTLKLSRKEVQSDDRGYSPDGKRAAFLEISFPPRSAIKHRSRRRSHFPDLLSLLA